MSASPEPNGPLPRGHLVAVFLVAFAVLAFEVGLTRVFSVVLHHHYVFLAVSTAICGLGLGGFGLHAWRARSGRDRSASTLSLAAAAFALASVVVLVVLLRWLFPYHLEAYWLAAALVLVPFVAAGVFLAEVFALHGARAGGVYAADLLGSAIAAVAVVALLQTLGAIGACLAASALAACAASAAARSRHGRLAGAALAVACVAFTAIGSVARVLDVGPVRVAAAGEASLAKPLFADLAKPPLERPQILATRWNAIARTDLVENPAFGELRRDIFQVFTNGHVPTYLMRVDADLRTTPIDQALDRIPALAHFSHTGILAFRSGELGRVLCIGPGAGADVLLALLHGAERVEGAELNPSIVELVHELADFAGHLYEHPAVDVSVAEGRSYVRRSHASYDLIFSALTQTATASGAAALMEDYVYTQEAFGEYWRHLTPRGRVAFIVHEPTLMMRLVTTALAVLAGEGLDEPHALQHLALFEQPDSPYRHLVLLSRAPFAPETLDALAESASELELGVLFLPGRVAGVLEPALADGGGIERWLVAGAQSVDPATGETRRLDLSPCTDDRPFFFDIQEGLPPGLGGLCAFAAVLALAFTAAAIALRRGSRATLGSVAPFAAHFSLLGAGFMLIEIPLIQKLALAIGYPTLALTSTLFGLLVGGGLGSAWSGRKVDDPRLARAIVVAGLAVATLAGLIAWLLPAVDLFLLELPVAARLAAVVGGLALLGFFLGMPFPSGIRLLAHASPDDIPWMWGINGVLSVVGSLLAVILGLELGFRAALLGGAGAYLAVAALAPRIAGRSGPGGRSVPAGAPRRGGG